jgi:hypothetical protein
VREFNLSTVVFFASAVPTRTRNILRLICPVHAFPGRRPFDVLSKCRRSRDLVRRLAGCCKTLPFAIKHWQNGHLEKIRSHSHPLALPVH